ncbi:O-sialoglycoprotein endopeptidase [Sporomusa termitida]|uniref:N(6)-L-threonylcarbamoyladenine synthase n=1 Tax=Sporomusa termitida TaxID=2377 RepID=A0A517DTX0_9FIRM|nr:O-sialoglycoprotein endopeptidase [Sporomusa termitida]QDR80802.1 tRNA N6-adenosine threonylcarbamoyltransferase [Sporomusa termitida]
MSYFLGIDTSCYTSSVALLNEAGQLVADCRRILQVKAGSRGLQQSAMVFQHTRNLPELFAEACRELPGPVAFKGIAVSAYPRPLPDSYMPAFLVGDGYAKVLALSHNVPLQRISHQESHIFAGLWSAGGPGSAQFLAVHLSGGTTELMRVSAAAGPQQAKRLKIEIIGCSQDIQAGQLVDRVGVLLGLPFPAGPHLEALAAQDRSHAVKIPVCVRGTTVSFAGPETHVRKLVTQGTDRGAIAAGVELSIATAVMTMLKQAVASTGLTEVLLVGGVMANRFIRHYLSEQLERPGVAKLYFPENRYSPDNAAGAAYAAFNA